MGHLPEKDPGATLLYSGPAKTAWIEGRLQQQTTAPFPLKARVPPVPVLYIEAFNRLCRGECKKWPSS